MFDCPSPAKYNPTTMPAPDIMAGDVLTITVPPNLVDTPVVLFSMAYGRHTFRVLEVSLAAKDGPDAVRLTITNNRMQRHFTIIPIERLDGYGFIGLDKHPVPYKLTPNLELRLKSSFTAQKGQHA